MESNSHPHPWDGYKKLLVTGRSQRIFGREQGNYGEDRSWWSSPVNSPTHEIVDSGTGKLLIPTTHHLTLATHKGKGSKNTAELTTYHIDPTHFLQYALYRGSGTDNIPRTFALDTRCAQTKYSTKIYMHFWGYSVHQNTKEPENLTLTLYGMVGQLTRLHYRMEIL